MEPKPLHRSKAPATASLLKLLAVMLLAFFAFQSSALAKRKPETQVVLITGTASGIGKATATHLVQEGHVVYGGDIQVEENRYLDKIGGHSLEMDVTKEEMVQAAVDRVIKEQGRIDVLVNNAGFGLYAPIEEVSMEDARYQFEVNFFGVAMVTRAVLPHMRSQRSGRIINISSMGGKIYMPLGAYYHGTKHAIEGWSDCLRLEVKEFGIKVVIIEPGAINTNFGTPVKRYLKKYAPGTNYGHLMDPMIKMTDDPDMQTMGSDPIVIAETVERAMTARRPRTRYRKGRMSKFMIGYRNAFGDRAFDRMIMRTMR